MEELFVSHENLLILGAGQFGVMVKEIAESINCFAKISFLDDFSEQAIGKIGDYALFADEYQCAIVAIGNPTLREKFIQDLVDFGFKVPSLISPYACVFSSASVGKGSIVEPMATVQSNATLGDGCIVSSGAVVRHNAVVGAFCHLDCNSVALSYAEIPQKTKVSCCQIYPS